MWIKIEARIHLSFAINKVQEISLIYKLKVVLLESGSIIYHSPVARSHYFFNLKKINIYIGLRSRENRSLH